MFFRRLTPTAQAEKLAPVLLAGASEIAERVLSDLQQGHQIQISAESGLQFRIEMLVFCIHFVDRAAFANFRGPDRLEFLHALLVGMARFIAPHLGREAGTAFVGHFRYTFNERQTEYSQYCRMFPGPNETLGGTLFWEFTQKVVFGLRLEVATDLSLLPYLTRGLVDPILALMNSSEVKGTLKA